MQILMAVVGRTQEEKRRAVEKASIILGNTQPHEHSIGSNGTFEAMLLRYGTEMKKRLSQTGLVTRWRRTRQSCLCVLGFGGRQNLGMEKFDIWLRLCPSQVLMEQLGFSLPATVKCEGRDTWKELSSQKELEGEDLENSQPNHIIKNEGVPRRTLRAWSNSWFEKGLVWV